jgi:hypothetical protein
MVWVLLLLLTVGFPCSTNAADQRSEPDEFRLEHWECLFAGCRVGVGTLRRDGQATYEFRRWSDTLHWPKEMLDGVRRRSDTVSGFVAVLDPAAFRTVRSIRTRWVPLDAPIRRASDGFGALVSVRVGGTWQDLDSALIESKLIRVLDSLFARARWSVQTNRMTGAWTLELRVKTLPQHCSPTELDGAGTNATVTIGDSAKLKGPWAYPEQVGFTALRWNWLKRSPAFGRGEVLISWPDDSTLSFSVDHWGTHDGGVYGQGQWFGDSVVGEWEQAGYCPTPSGSFILRRTR